MEVLVRRSKIRMRVGVKNPSFLGLSPTRNRKRKMARMSIVRCSIHFSLLAAGVGGWVVSCYNLCEDYWPNIARGADSNTRDDTQCPWSAGWKLCEKYKYARELIPYDSIASVGKTGVWWRADFQSGSRVLKKVFWTFSYLYLWHTMWFHAKKLLKTLNR